MPEQWEHTKRWHTDAAESKAFFISKREAKVRFSAVPEKYVPHLEVIYQNQKPYYEELQQMKESSLLESHFPLFYQKLAEVHVHPEAFFEENKGVKRCFSGICDRYYNMVMGVPVQEDQWGQYIEEQLEFFKKAGVPFVWYVNEASSSKFKDKLTQHGFKDGGVFRGVIGTLDRPISPPDIPADCTLELVQEERVMDEWIDVVSATFGMGAIKDICKQALWEAAVQSKMFHWLARKDGKPVSALSTIIAEDTVSFWHGATLPEMRKQGLSSALRRLALQHAVSRGCRNGASYLMSEGLAYGICQKLGYETKWRFNVFLSNQ